MRYGVTTVETYAISVAEKLLKCITKKGKEINMTEYFLMCEKDNFLDAEHITREQFCKWLNASVSFTSKEYDLTVYNITIYNVVYSPTLFNGDFYFQLAKVVTK